MLRKEDAAVPGADAVDQALTQKMRFDRDMLLEMCLSEIPKREAYVLERLFCSTDTITDISERIRVSRTRVYELREQGLKKLTEAAKRYASLYFPN